MAERLGIESRALQVRIRRDVCSISSGNAILEIPEPLRPYDYEDILAWLNLVAKRLAREGLATESTEQEGSLREVRRAAQRGVWDMTGLTPAAEEE